MRWEVAWTLESDRDLYAVGFVIGSSVGHAVRRWAATGEGWTEPSSEDHIRVLAEGGYAIVAVDLERRLVSVLRVVADHPLAHVAPLLDEPEGDGEDD